MDTEQTFELCLHLLYDKQTIQYTGQDFDKMQNSEAARILQSCLLTTVGDKLKHLIIDNNGNVKQKSKLPDGVSPDKFEPLNKAILDERAEGIMQGCFLEP